MSATTKFCLLALACMSGVTAGLAFETYCITRILQRQTQQLQVQAADPVRDYLNLSQRVKLLEQRLTVDEHRLDILQALATEPNVRPLAPIAPVTPNWNH